MKLMANVVLSLILSTTLILAFSRGPVPGVTGGLGEPTCNQAGCHNSFELNAGRTLGLGDFTISGVPEKYEPGKTYPITVTHTQTDGRAAWGFQLAARAQTLGEQAGQLQPVDRNTQIVLDGGIQYIEHTLQGSSFRTFTFNWVAPDGATGPVTFNAAGNAANGNSSPTGDYIYTASATSQSPQAQDQQFAQVQYLPHIAVGGPSRGIHMSTTVFLINNTTQGASGIGELFSDDGIPLPLQITSSGANSLSGLGSRFDWRLGPRQMVRVVLTIDAPDLSAGWLRVSSDLAIGVTAVFQLFDGDRLMTQAGVLSSPARRSAASVYDHIGTGTDTGLAFSNTSDQENTLTLTLFGGRSGQQLQTTTLKLPPNGHVAKFISELFPTAPNITAMEGSVSISGSLPFSAMTLRVDGTVLTTLPILSDGSEQ
ncbi:MAG: hypothetical protein HY644_10380 [Acidobacteria bacterium]|nr:hypothetical protein [Acidobacteriota bacterium]